MEGAIVASLFERVWESQDDTQIGRRHSGDRDRLALSPRLPGSCHQRGLERTVSSIRAVLHAAGGAPMPAFRASRIDRPTTLAVGETDTMFVNCLRPLVEARS
jgi:hypothetical protein